MKLTWQNIAAATCKFLYCTKNNKSYKIQFKIKIENCVSLQNLEIMLLHILHLRHCQMVQVSSVKQNVVYI